MKIVSPFRPFVAESSSHVKMGAFDWVDALRMLRTSARRHAGVDVVAITDVDTELPVPAHRYVTTQRRLMLWILDVACRFLESDDFDQDTVMLSPDMLVFGDVRRFFVADLGVVVRIESKYRKRPLLNCAQWWRYSAKNRLVTFYRAALDLAVGLSDDALIWGADTIPLVELLRPLSVGHMARSGLMVQGIPHGIALAAPDCLALERGRRVAWPSAPLVDFKYTRKSHMRAYFDATIGSRVPA